MSNLSFIKRRSLQGLCDGAATGYFKRRLSLRETLQYSNTMNNVVFFSAVWSLFIVAAATTSVRIIARKLPYRYEVLASISSLFLFFVCCVINTTLAALYYHHTPKSDPKSFFRLQFCSNLLYLSSLWLAKLGILTSYYVIVHSFGDLKRAWFSILGMVVMAYVCCVISYPFTDCSDAGKQALNPIANTAHTRI